MSTPLKILLTGATGFLGSALANAWVSAGHRVTVLVRPQSSLNRLEPVRDQLDVQAPVDDDSLIQLVVETRPDAIVHTACAYGRQGETLLQLFDTNVRLGMGLLQATVGNDRKTTFINTGTVLDPLVSHYARSKHQLADWGRQLAEERPTRLQFINVALQHMYGPGDSDSKFTTHVIRSCVRHAPELALTAGEQKRDFVYIDDVVSAYTTLLDQRQNLDGPGDVQLGSGTAPPVREFVETAHRIAASTTRLNFGAVPYRPTEAMSCKADITRLKELGWQPRFDLNAGIARTIELESMI